MIRVLVVDDHAVVRAGISGLLDSADDIDVVGAAVDGREAAAMAEDLAPDVVLMDIDMPGTDGLEGVRMVCRAHPYARVVMLTAFCDRDRVLAALDAGAVGYLVKDADPDGLFDAVRAAAAGESPLAPRAAAVLVAERASGRPVDSTDLSDREREVLGLLGEGLPNKLIAMRLGIAEKTVKTHLTSVFRRIGVSDRTQAALWAQKHGL